MRKSNFSKQLTKYRKIKGISQKELAEKTGLTQAGIAYYENTETIDFVNKIEKLAEALDVTPSALFEYYKGTEEERQVTALNPKVMKKVNQLLALTPGNRTKIYEQIDFYTEKENKK
jgi:transcriptional regulator with XRE-family HTH domain